MENLYTHLEQHVLRMDSSFCTEDGQLLKNKVVEAALALDPKLLRYLLEDEKVKSQFFKEVDGLLVFDKVKFQRFVLNKSFLPDSYTSFKNKIGLTNENGEFLSESREVVLSWPYKDCMLEGGQTKEDAKRDEIFWNETLAPDEINRLTEPKAFTSFRRYDKQGEHEATVIKKEDNLIIKGNNLLALYSLRKRFRNSVKLIYIDPPYNTGNDSFGYNDNFNHSTWLTFMKNRLEVAKELLSKDGTIAISIDNYEIAYIMVLLDSILGKQNRKNIITIKRASASGAKVINPGVVNIVEYVVLYSKDTEYWKPNRVFQTKEYDTRYNGFIKNIDDPFEQWEFTTVLEAMADQYQVPKAKLRKQLGDRYDDYLERFIIKNAKRIFRLAALDDNQIGTEALKAKKESLANPNRIIHMPRAEAKDYYLLNGNAILFAIDRMINVDGELTFGQPATDIWDDVLPNDLHNEGAVDFKKGKKPEKLIARIVELCTKEGDICMDFFAGSGTLPSVSHKMNRQWVGVEQMDYIKTITSQRLLNVINGEQRGVSKTYNWQGGGSFVYCELAQANQRLVEEIEAATDTQVLQQIWLQMQEKGFLSYKVTPKMINEHVKEFEELSLEDQKRFLIECLDKNLLYVPFDEMDDEAYQMSEQDKQLTRQFYALR